MRFEGSRRLTGPSLQTRGPAAIAELVVEPGENLEALVSLWREELSALCARLSLGQPVTSVRTYTGGASLTLEGAIDVLYALVDINDYAVERALSRLRGVALEDDAERLAALGAALAARANPTLTALQAEAARRGVPFLWDDDCVSVGHGKHSESWPVSALPEPSSVSWSEKRPIPIALITGTNGKTTTSRMLTRILRSAGHTPGNTTTDGIYVGEALVEAGDWTGPGAARKLLRHPEVDVAVLETARGGILRRGLAVPSAEVAIITNVSADHLGEYGVCTAADMARVKAVVGAVVRPGGRVVLCADDANLVPLADAGLFAAPVIWFGADPRTPIVREHLRAGGEAWLLEAGALAHHRGAEARRVVRADEIPATFAGAARHNVLNALGAAAMAGALGISDEVIAGALRTFGAVRSDNPGRADLRTVDGVRVLLDFGHNPHGLAAILELVEQLLAAQPGRLFIGTAQAGDRSDHDIHELCKTIAGARPHRVYVREMPAYLRGRVLGELPALFTASFDRLGLGEAVRLAQDEVDVLRRTLQEAQRGDLLLMTPHLERAEVEAFLRQRASS